MDLSSVSSSSGAVKTASQTQEEFAIRVADKAIDIGKQQGEMLAQLIGQSAGLGKNVNIMG